nr:MAG TPA: hypothetical protein [Caudoviricetes sp.]
MKLQETFRKEHGTYPDKRRAWFLSKNENRTY